MSFRLDKWTVSGMDATETLEHHYQQEKSKHQANTHKLTYVGQTVPGVLSDLDRDSVSGTMGTCRSGERREKRYE